MPRLVPGHKQKRGHGARVIGGLHRGVGPPCQDRERAITSHTTRHIGLIALVVPDYDEALAFYVDAVGFTLVEDTDLGGGKRWVVVSPSTDPASCGLLFARADGERQRASIGQHSGGRVGLFLYTDDFDADHARMSAAGVAFDEAPRTEPYGTVAVWRDPWGNRWDLIEPAPRTRGGRDP